MGKKIIIYDTTLRDGMQGLGVNYTLADKLQIAVKLDEMKINYIEGGFPLSSDKEAKFFEEIKKLGLKHSRIASFGSTRKPGVKAETDINIRALLEAETLAVTIVGKTWLAHVDKVIQTSPGENLQMIYDSVEYLKKEGREVIFDLEHFFDGFKDDAAYALKVLQTASSAGADCLVLCDTNGGTLPSEIEKIIKSLPQHELAPLGVHLHNDTGTAAAGSLSAVDAGAVHIQGTINGLGERCGNANLCTLIPNICLKTGNTADSADRLLQLTSLSRFVFEKTNIIPDKRQPYVGEAAFSHKAGQHADVINKAANLMEHIDSSLVGNERKILLSELAGKSTIIGKLNKYGNFDKDSDAVQALINTLKTREIEGYEYEAAEASFDLLIRKTLGLYKSLVELSNYHLESYKTAWLPSKTVGRIFLRSDKGEIMGAACGTGPVETLDRALRDGLEQFYPFIKTISLTDYSVRVLNPEGGSSSKVRVFITSTDRKSTWDTVGVSENIIEASWQALVDSIEYYYNTYILEQ